MVKKNILKGIELLNNPRYNKDGAFSLEERRLLGLEGFLPAAIESEDTQVQRVLSQISHLSQDIDKFVYLANLQDRNETLYYRLLISDPAMFLPIVYDPMVGEACLKFGHIFRKTRGIYLSLADKGKIKSILHEWPEKDVRFIVITDGERILGLGDLGTNGMGIPIGKLALYTAIAGVPPQYQLPVHLDVGTNTPELLNDSLYMGLRQPRTDGSEYLALVDEFIQAVQELFPRCCIQFEDFANYHAVSLLERYREKVCMFNDDIQGTGAVTAAGFYSAERYTGKKISEHTILFLGAGSAARGIADMLCYAMKQEGLTDEQARARCWMFDTKGLVVKGRERLEFFKQPYAHEHSPLVSFVESIQSIKPTAIVGVSTQPNLFTKEVIQAMAEINERPLIFPLSNPTTQEECTAEEAYRYSNGKALFAAGVLFPQVVYQGREFQPAQANNLWIFPPVGMAVFATEAIRVTDEMFLVAAKTLANQLTREQIDKEMLFPPESQIVTVATAMAAAVARVIFERGFARVERPNYDDQIIKLVESKMYHPYYESYIV
jgi:malate dehydrogenase (oxaloacetate-decarboxylating)(NADP+)